jgi:hypothetical protein
MSGWPRRLAQLVESECISSPSVLYKNIVFLVLVFMCVCVCVCLLCDVSLDVSCCLILGFPSKFFV